MTAPQEEWTDWFHHDGKGCPCMGEWVQAEAVGEHGNVYGNEGIAMCGDNPCWVWDNFLKIVFYRGKRRRVVGKVIRFRIRRPKGMAILNAILADLPAPVKTDGVIA